MHSLEPELNPYLQGCPTRRILDLIGDRWTVLIVGALADETRRFSELLRSVDGISQKMLTQTLRAMERDGLLTRTAYLQVPVRVDYRLTEAGQSLRAPLKVLEDWSIEHFADIRRSRTEYDSLGA
ncbi:helix-turn-helix transcriptional regulator [Pengzhenrongella sicca]|uniref:Helix-turn-helix transcriptional regulator n=2 Tax=Pengzhenrongella sicca TaxID=2819238 RepID=A0A8A4ZK09_9MICO|nr:helix-turn-helix transcriptional regulator [Pengzhenrongella sicca]